MATTCTEETFESLRLALAELMPASHELRDDDRWEELIPPEERRRVWAELRRRGLPLPPLQLRDPIRLALVLEVLIFTAVIYREVDGWWAAIALPLAGTLAYLLSRPVAVWPEQATVRAAVVAMTPFRIEDYQAGRWSHRDIGDKVRLIISEACAVPYETINDQTLMADLLDC